MSEHFSEQLDKILALADSSHDGEAILAVRKARQILSKGGLNFSDLARAAFSRQKTAGTSRWGSLFSGSNDYLESDLHYLRQQVEDLQAQIQTQDLQLDFWRRRAVELEQSSSEAQTEVDRWKKLAHHTVESLWDIGQKVTKEDFAARVFENDEARIAGKK